jgi:hypothetical protein
MIRSQEDICKKLGISNEVLEKSEMILMERGFANHMLLLQATAREKIKYILGGFFKDKTKRFYSENVYRRRKR